MASIVFTLLLTLSVAAASSTFVSLDVSGHCRLSLSEVLPVDSDHALAFKPLPRPLPANLRDVEVDRADFGTIGFSAEFDDYRYLVTYRSRESGEEVGVVMPDPRLRFADTHGTHSHGGGGEDDDNDGNERDPSHDHEHPAEDAKDPSTHSDVAPHFFLMPTDSLLLWVPSYVTELKVYCHNTSNAWTTTLPRAAQRRHFLPKDATNANFTVKNVQSVGPPERTHNVVFLSSGYIDSKPFDDTIRTLMSFLPLNVTNPFASTCGFGSGSCANFDLMQNSVPFDRYLPFWNVYSVYQKSPQAGCSRPKIGLQVNDNLQCYHQPQLENALACNHGLAQAMADVSPAPVRSRPDQVLIVVIVNSSVYGGTGLFQRGTIHIGQFYNGVDFLSSASPERYASLVNHEVGHAFGGLFDEYDIGSSTSFRVPLANCQAPDRATGGVPNPPFWSFWQSVFVSGGAALQATYRGSVLTQQLQNGNPPRKLTDFGVTGIPTQPCGYSNYYKPNTNCMMNKLADFFMCPVCRENSSVAALAIGFSYQYPRFPLEDNIMLISGDNSTSMISLATGIVLHLPTSLDSSNSFAVTWQTNSSGNGWINVANPPLGGCPVCLYIAPSTLSAYAPDQVIFYRASISDQSYYLSPQTASNLAWQLNQVAIFRLLVNSTPYSRGPLGNMSTYPAVQNIAFDFGLTQLLADRVPGAYICNPLDGNVTRGGYCALEGSSKSYNAPDDLAGVLAKYESYILYLLGGIVVLFVLLWVYGARRYKNVSGRIIRPIVRTKFSGAVACIRRIMTFSAVLFMIASFGTVAISAYYYTKTDFIGKIILLAGTGIALGLYIMAFVGFWAVAHRSRRLTVLNAVIMFFGMAVLLGLLVFFIHVKNEISDPNSHWAVWLDGQFVDLVANNPGQACSLEGLLGCSGYNISCAVSSPDLTYCPANCNVNNQNGVACYDRIVEFINDHYMIVVQVVGACIGLLAFAVVFNFIYLCSLVTMKRSIQAMMLNRARQAVPSHVSSQAASHAKALYLLRSLDVGDLQHLIREFHRMDMDGSLSLDRRELFIFFKKGLCYDITPKELDDLFRAMDINNDGSITLHEFLTCVHPEKATSALSTLDIRKTQRGGSGGRRDEHVVALNAVSSPRSNAQEIQRRLADVYQGSGVFENEMLPEQPTRSPYKPPVNFLARLIAFYHRYQPTKVGSAQETLDKFAGREGDLFAALVAKYGPEPTEAEFLPPPQVSYQQPPPLLQQQQQHQPPAVAYDPAQKPAPGTAQAAAPSPSPSPSQQQQNLTRLIAFYQAYDASKIPEAPRILQSFAGREDRLFQMLMQKYGPEPGAALPAAAV